MIQTKEETFQEEVSILVKEVKQSISKILLSKDRTSKHEPYTWMSEPIDQHLLKACRHINTHIQVTKGYQKESKENHLNNAITRLAMAIVLVND